MRAASARLLFPTSPGLASHAAFIFPFFFFTKQPETHPWLEIVTALLVTVLVVWAIFLALIYFWPRSRNPAGIRPPRSSTSQQVTPPIRLLNLWLTHGPLPGGLPVSENAMLVVGEPYHLNMQIKIPGQPEQIPVTSPLLSYTAPQGTHVSPPRGLRVVLYTPQEDVQIDRTPEDMTLLGNGGSEKAGHTLIPLHPGILRVRACLYYGSVLLQSVYLEFNAALPSGRGLSGRVQQVIDYAASYNLADLNHFLQPAVSIFTNHAAEGTCWIGVYSDKANAEPRLKSGFLKTFQSAEIARLAEELRHMLAVVQGGQSYRYEPNLPQADCVARLEGDLVNLAITGWRVYHRLFGDEADSTQNERPPRMQSPGIISIARCQGKSPSIPWTALYDLRLDTRTPEAIRLCARFKANLIAPNPQPPAPTGGIPCRELADCPLNRENRRVTVCPYGFWGFLHQIEQPIQALHILPRARPKDMRQLNQTSFLVRPRNQKIRLGMGIYPGIPGANVHVGELRAAAVPNAMEVFPAANSRDVLRLLTESGCHIYYLYTHGVVQDGVFQLIFGPAGRETCLAAADLESPEGGWKDSAHPLVILNGSETSELTPDLLHSFLGAFKALGASGVVGSEIPIHVRLAMPFGHHLLCQMLSGSSIGESFLTLRRGFLMLGNPLGLIYTFYAPAGLHLHDPSGCRWCKIHGVG